MTIRRRAFVTGGKKRQTIWSSIMVRAAGVALAGGAKSTGGLGALGVSSGGGVTLMRTRGHGVVRMDPGAISDSGILGCALGVFSSDAFTAGSASLPGPITDIDYDWLWHSLFSFGPVITATDTENSILTNVQVELDSKAMRILKPSQTLGFMFEALNVAGSPTYDFAFSTRQLFKLG